MTQKAVGVGARAHEVEIIGKAPLRHAAPGSLGHDWRYQAKCSCGWRGADRTSSQEAADDEFAHIIAEEG